MTKRQSASDFSKTSTAKAKDARQTAARQFSRDSDFEPRCNAAEQTRPKADRTVVGQVTTNDVSTQRPVTPGIRGACSAARALLKIENAA
jgi:hypothetical protein